MKFLIALCSILFALNILPVKVESHVLTNDDNVGAVIHIDPEDNPIAGKESIINFELKDKNNFFTYSECTCSVSISKSGNEIYSQTLDRSNNAGSVPFIFPETGEYTINISGIPDDNESFPKFSLNQKVIINKTQNPTNNPTTPPTVATTSSPTNMNLLLFIPIIGIISFIAYRKIKK